MGGKKGLGEGSKKAQGQARKADAAAGKKAAEDAKKAAVEEAEWDKGAKKANAKKYVLTHIVIIFFLFFLKYIIPC